MYHDLREVYWGDDLNKDISEFVAKCPNRQQDKDENLKPGGLTQIMDVPTWKWEPINIDFVFGMSRSLEKNDSISVIMDRLTKSVHFIPVKSHYTAE